MKLPRDVSAQQLIRALHKLGYAPVRQVGSHIRLRTIQNGEHFETVPWHNPLKVGTLNAILRNIATHHGLSRDELLKKLDL
ncbi:MAG: type II toxin-antitoxin system HicA family toxin [Planctomycetes bacterium]|nr:type II toxin-antitoxin system HicA family toxin [Planctomycetota bacterium]